MTEESVDTGASEWEAQCNADGDNVVSTQERDASEDDEEDQEVGDTDLPLLPLDMNPFL